MDNIYARMYGYIYLLHELYIYQWFRGDGARGVSSESGDGDCRRCLKEIAMVGMSCFF